MKVNEFKERYDLASLLEKLARKYLEQFLSVNPTLKIIGFGADCNIDEADILMCILTEEGMADVPNWLKNWEWIGEWDHWNFNEGFDEEDSFQEVKTKVDELSFDLEEKDFGVLKNYILSITYQVLVKLHKEYEQLKGSTLIIRDHGDMQEESVNRLEKYN